MINNGDSSQKIDTVFVDPIKHEMERPAIAQHDDSRCRGITRAGLSCIRLGTLDGYCEIHDPKARYTCGAMTQDGGSCRWPIIKAACPVHGVDFACAPDDEYDDWTTMDTYAHRLVGVWRKDSQTYAGSVTFLDRRRARTAAQRLRFAPYSAQEFAADLNSWAQRHRPKYQNRDEWIDVAQDMGAELFERRANFRDGTTMSSRQAASVARQFAYWSWRNVG